MSAAYARMRRKKRLRDQPMDRNVWLRGEGFVYAQPALCRSPQLVLGLFAVCVLMSLFLLVYLVWVLRPS
jgi:hypothetical protein